MSKRTWGVAALMILTVGSVAGCHSATPIPRAQLEKALVAQVAPDLGELPSNVHCDGSLLPVKGKSQACVLVDRGVTYHVQVKVTGSSGATRAIFDTPLPTFSAAKIEASVAKDYAKGHGATPDSVHCVGSGLSATPGDHIRCQLAVGSKQITATVTTGEADAKTGITNFTTAYSR